MSEAQAKAEEAEADRPGTPDSAPPPYDEQTPSRIYPVYKDFWARHYEIKTPDDQPLFYADISLFSLGKPDLTLHAGSSTQGPVVAVSNFVKWGSGNYKLGLGNPDDPNSVQWEDMIRETLRASRYRFEMNIAGQRRAFLWKRTRHVGVDDAKLKSFEYRNFKLVDERTGKLQAVFTAERTFHKCGKLQIIGVHDEDFEKMVFISYMSIYEKARRLSRSGGYGGGGA